MPGRFISFRGSDVDTAKLRTVCSTYFEYEQARTVRQLLTRRLLPLLLGTGAVTVGLHLLPIVALVAVVALCAASVSLCVRTELRAKRRLVDELRDVPPTDGAAIPP